MTKSARKIVIAVIAVILALAAATAGSLAWFSDSVSIHAGIKTSKITGTVSETTMAGTPDTNETWLESSTTIKDGDKVLFSALTSDYRDSLGAKDTIKTYNVSRGNALSVTGDSAVKTNQTFKVKYSNTNTSDEVFYPEIHVTAVDGKSLAQYEKVLGVADTSAKATLDKTIQYQNVVNGTSEELLTANIYSIPSLVSKTKVNSDGSLSLYLDGVMVKARETVECSYVLTENLSGHLDYTVPQVYVSTNATIRYASAVNSLWYGTAEAPSATSSVMYALAPDYQTRVLWRDVTGKYTVRGGHDVITVSDKDAAATTEALDYTVATYQYTGADQTPAAYLFGSKVNTKLYKAVDGKWTEVHAAVERGSYKAVVDTSDVEGFAVSHTEFYFSITKAVSNVDYGNKPGPDGQPDPDNKLTWSVDNADKEYDGKPISIVGTDKDGNTITDFIYTNKDTGESSEVPPKDVGTYVVKPKGDDNHEYTNTATITIRKKSLQVTPTVSKNPLLPTDKPSFGYTVTGFADGDNELDISGKGVQYIVDSNNVPASGQTYAVGSHDLTLSGLTAKNYDFVYGITSFGVGKGTTTVEYGNKPGPDGQPDPENKLTWTMNNARKVYDGKPAYVVAKTDAGKEIAVEYFESDGITKLTSEPVKAGTYIAKPVDDADNEYVGTATIVIEKAPLEITLKTVKSSYEATEAPEFTYSASGFVNGETEDVLTGTIQYEVYNGSGSTVSPDENGQYAVGTYFIRANGLTAENYTIQYKIGQLVVKKPFATGVKFGVTQYQMQVDDDLNTGAVQVFNCTPFYQYVTQPTVEFQNDTSKAVVFVPTITLSYADGSPVGVNEYYYCDGLGDSTGEYSKAEHVTVQLYTTRFISEEYSFVDTPVLQSKIKSAAIDNGDGTVSFTAGEYTVANNRSTSVTLGSLIKDAYSFADKEKTLIISVKCTARFEDDSITAPIKITDSANNRAQTTEAKIGTKINFGVAWRKSTARADWRLVWDQDASAVTFPANSDGSPVTGPIIYYTDDDSTVYTYDGKNFGDLMTKTYYKQIGDSWQQINADEVTSAGIYKIVAFFADDYAKFNDMFDLTHNEVQFTVTE